MTTKDELVDIEAIENMERNLSRMREIHDLPVLTENELHELRSRYGQLVNQANGQFSLACQLLGYTLSGEAHDPEEGMN